MTKLDKYCITIALMVVITWLYVDINKINMDDGLHKNLAFGFLVAVSICFGHCLEKFKMVTWPSFFVYQSTVGVALYFWYWSKPEDYTAVLHAWPPSSGMILAAFLILKYWPNK